MRWHEQCSASAFCPQNNALYDFDQLTHSVRLGHHPAEAMSLEVGHDWIVRKAAGDDRFDLRVKGHKLDDGLLAAHPTWDRQIQDDDIERLTGLSRSSIQYHRLRAVLR